MVSLNVKTYKLVTRKQVQELVGKLQCIISARRFVNRILNFLRCTPFKGKILTDSDVIDDISWFLLYAKNTNGPEIKQEWSIVCDSSLTSGGVHSPQHFFAEKYSQKVRDFGLNSGSTNWGFFTLLKQANLLHSMLEKTPNHTLLGGDVKYFEMVLLTCVWSTKTSTPADFPFEVCFPAIPGSR